MKSSQSGQFTHPSRREPVRGKHKESTWREPSSSNHALLCFSCELQLPNAAAAKVIQEALLQHVPSLDSDRERVLTRILLSLMYVDNQGARAVLRSHSCQLIK